MKSNNYKLSEGMAPRTYTPPLRRNQCRKYGIRRRRERDNTEVLNGTRDEGSRTGENLTRSDQPMESNMMDDKVYTNTLRDDNNPHSRSELTGLTECGAYSSTSERWNLMDGPVTKGDMARSGIKTDCTDREHSEWVDRPATESASAREGNDVMSPSYEQPEKQSLLVEKPDPKSLMSRSGGTAKLLSDVHLETVDGPVRESATAGYGSRLDSPKGEYLHADNPPDMEPERTRYKVVTNCHRSTVSEFSEKPVTRSGSARAGRSTDYWSDERPGALDRRVTE